MSSALERKAAKLEAKINQLQGQRKLLMSNLKKEFDCESIEDAEELLDELESEFNDLRSELSKGIKAFEKKWEAEL